MSYSTLAQFKEYIWIDVSDTSQDTLLSQFLNSANEKLNHLCWVDDFTQWTRTQIIEKRWISDTARWLEFYLKNKPVSAITKLNWQAYSWTKWTDYLIIYDRRAIFKQLPLNDWWMLEVEYTAWYQTIPDDLKLMEMMLASWMRQEHNYEWVSSYRLWDESITFGSKTSSNGAVLSPDDQYFSFSALLNKYKNFNLPL
jgi:hypothetical protein